VQAAQGQLQLSSEKQLLYNTFSNDRIIHKDFWNNTAMQIHSFQERSAEKVHKTKFFFQPNLQTTPHCNTQEQKDVCSLNCMKS